jgi:hypothetical protein
MDMIIQSLMEEASSELSAITSLARGLNRVSERKTSPTLAYEST